MTYTTIIETKDNMCDSNMNLLDVAKGIAVRRIDRVISNGHFKIGRSRDNVDDTRDRYTGKYNNWTEIFRGPANLIDDLEEILIQRYQESHPNLCDNVKVDDSEDESTYIYLAYD